MEYKIIRSRRKTACIQILKDGTVAVRAPYGFTDAMADAEIGRNMDWIISKQAEMTAGNKEGLFTEDELKRLRSEGMAWFPPRVASYAKAIGVTYGRISVKSQKTLWGSCSRKGNLNFNCLLMLAPEDVRDYVIVHELCHRRQMNHSKAFWQLVSRHYPDWESKRNWLRKDGRKYINRLPR